MEYERDTPEPTADRDRAAAVRRLAVAWTDVIEAGNYVSTSRAGLVSVLTEMAGQIVDVLDGRAAPASASAVGAALVDAHLTDPATLRCSIDVIGAPTGAGSRRSRRGGEDSADTKYSGEQVQQLVSALGALSSGYARALQNRTRAEQQRISSAAFSARGVAEAARWASEARYGAVFAHAVIGISVSDIDGTILEANQAMCRMLGYTPAELTGRSVDAFIHPDDPPETWAHVAEMTAGDRDHIRLEKLYYRKDRTQIWTELVVSLIRAPDSTPLYLVAMVEDVTERHELLAQLQQQADHDPLTGLPNRALFFRRLTAALHTPAPPARPAADHPGVCYLDLDGFKRVNDTLGHDVGDQLLRTISDGLQRALGADGHVVARTGGDEFVVLVEGGAGVDDLIPVARTALEVIRTPVLVYGREICISASAGLVAGRRDPCDQDDGECRCSAELMKAADTTMYWAKQDGGDRFAVFDSARHRNDVAMFELSGRMPAALDGGEFEVDYQPLVRLSDRRVVGVEALVRWQLPDGERLGPDTFIPLAEQTGMIVPLGRHILQEACLRATAWQDHDPDPHFRLSVNVAGRQMRQPDIVEQIARTLRETGWPAGSLQLELTESDVMSASGGPLEALHALSGMGVSIAIDDFGTGYSNLAYLHRLPVDVIKLAGSFVVSDGSLPDGSPSGRDLDSPVVIAALIDLAHTLGLTVVAESVETAEQADRLHALGCDVGQGWYFARPGPAGSVRRLLAASRNGRSR